jgi:hypothetical protein
MIRNTFLRGYLLEYFAREAQMLKQAIFVPLGPKVSRVLSYLAGRGVLHADRILDGLQNPSAANTERIAYLLDRKPREKLSVKTNAQRIDEAKELLRQKIERLRTA